MQGNLLSGFPAGIPEFPDSRESIPAVAKKIYELFLVTIVLYLMGV
jgi:hypothetical protein